MSYQPGIPTGFVNLDEDYQNLQNNFTAINNYIGLDHVPFSPNIATSGYHTAIHMVNQGSNPTPVASTGELFTKSVNDGYATDSVMYYQTAGGLLTQLTRNLQPSAAANGYTFIPGGLVLQWGVVNGSHSGAFNDGDTNTITFSTANRAFQNNCFGVWIQPLFTNGNPPASQRTATFSVNSNFSKTAFTWYFVSSSGSYTKFFWWALGN